MPTRRGQARPSGVRTPGPPVVPSARVWGACGGPLGKDGAPPRDGQRACSGRCRAALHRREQVDRLAARNTESPAALGCGVAASRRRRAGMIRRLPQGQKLKTLAIRLGVSMAEIGTHEGLESEPELQRRVQEAQRSRRESWLWLVAILAMLASIASALAAWWAVARCL
jgi:hypothetical protein